MLKVWKELKYSITLIYFFNENKKISYKIYDSDIEHQYILSSIFHDFFGYTTTITMYCFIHYMKMK